MNLMRKMSFPVQRDQNPLEQDDINASEVSSADTLRGVLVSDHQRIDKKEPHTSIKLSEANVVPLEPPIQITPPKRPEILCEFPEEKETPTKVLAKVHTLYRSYLQ
ncbi:unnamed protein product [Acanthoscelides obtectus]|uniref:Uncharacterized protein n=1 Tax=Acanthoscelides obtectus TaxID=200917 RepID=A0A9P0Q8F4_ACAOB|nr:unnamed protein product [Acanthoscelides obtectus]CAK1640424.1 hypothetical protein AOBTE_LOCUS11715 [Acanthoscelides obtectus]